MVKNIFFFLFVLIAAAFAIFLAKTPSSISIALDNLPKEPSTKVKKSDITIAYHEVPKKNKKSIQKQKIVPVQQNTPSTKSTSPTTNISNDIPSYITKKVTPSHAQTKQSSSPNYSSSLSKNSRSNNIDNQSPPPPPPSENQNLPSPPPPPKKGIIPRGILPGIQY